MVYLLYRYRYKYKYIHILIIILYIYIYVCAYAYSLAFPPWALPQLRGGEAFHRFQALPGSHVVTFFVMGLLGYITYIYMDIWDIWDIVYTIIWIHLNRWIYIYIHGIHRIHGNEDMLDMNGINRIERVLNGNRIWGCEKPSNTVLKQLISVGNLTTIMGHLNMLWGL